MPKEPFIIVIDDEHSLEAEAASQDYLEAACLSDLLNELFKQPQLLLLLLTSDQELIIALDEDLAYGALGHVVYEGLGKFLQTRAKYPDKIYFIGVSSNQRSQVYLPETNRSDKRFFAYASVRNLLLGEGKCYQPLSVGQIFNPDGFHTPQGFKSYSSAGQEVFNRLETVYQIALLKTSISTPVDSA